MSPMEGRSLVRGSILLLLLSLLRGGLELRRKTEPILGDAPSQLEALQEESRKVREEEIRRKLPLKPGETLDPNRSSEVELDRLPGLGPSAASAVVESREREGGFRRPEDLLRVRGIGPATLEKIRGHLDFSRGLPLELGRAGRRETAATPSVQPLTGAPRGRGEMGVPLPTVDLNLADAAELQTLPGIGPALAERILASRAREGPFRTPEDLLRVSGIGPVTLERLRSRIRAGG